MIRMCVDLASPALLAVEGNVYSELKNKYLNRLFTLQFGSTYLIIHLIFDYQLISVDSRLISGS